MADAWNVGRNLDPVGKAHTGNLAQGRVRLLGRLRVNAGANTAPLRRGLQRRRGRLVARRRAPLAYELIKSRQTELLPTKKRAAALQLQPRAGPSGHLCFGQAYSPIPKRRSPLVAASRLPSIQSQTRNGTVAERFP